MLIKLLLHRADIADFVRFNCLQLLFIGPIVFAVYGTLVAALLYIVSSPVEFWRKISAPGDSVPQ
jgi:hypothetical protein